MKFILLATILSIALANTFFFRAPGLAKPISDVGAPECITDYFTAFFKAFDLDQPKQILSCFGEKEAKLYWVHLYEVANLVQDAEHREKIHVHLDWAKLLLLHKPFEALMGCVSATSDFTDLINALGAKERNPQLFALAQYLYYQGYMGKLAGEFPQIIGAVNNKNFTGAGTLAAGLVESMANDIKKQGLAVVALNGLWNGVHIGLGLPDAHSVNDCWRNDTATVRLEFIYGLAHAASSGKWNEAEVNTANWYNQTGNALLEKIPSSAWKCWASSDDTKAESEKLGADITSKEFYQKVADFVHNHQFAYWAIQRGIKENMEQHNFLHAGSAYAHLLQAASK